MSETRPVVLLGGAIAIIAVFLARFRPALLLLTETARPALAAIAVVLAMLAVGTGSLIAAQRFFGREIEREIPLLDAFIVGFPTFGTLDRDRRLDRRRDACGDRGHHLRARRLRAC